VSDKLREVLVEPAVPGEHKLLLAISKESRYTRDFSHIMFSGPAAYEKEWVLVARRWRGVPLGFCCLRHCKNKPHTSLYYVAVREGFRGQGVGEKLLAEALRRSPHGRLNLRCHKENAAALAFYRRLRFTFIREDGDYHILEKEVSRHDHKHSGDERQR